LSCEDSLSLSTCARELRRPLPAVQLRYAGDVVGTATGQAAGNALRWNYVLALAVDGRVVVLGGLIKDDVQDAQQKVPLLGDIPYLGRLFRSDGEKVTKSNLMVFIRSTIIRDNAQLAGATAQKYRHIREQQVKQREQGMTFLEDSDLPVLKEREDQMRQLDSIKEEAATTTTTTVTPASLVPEMDGQ